MLPEINTSKDRAAEELLERGNADNRVDVSGGDIGDQKAAKTYKVLGMKRDGDFRWDWRTGRVEDMIETPETTRSRPGDLRLFKQ